LRLRGKFTLAVEVVTVELHQSFLTFLVDKVMRILLVGGFLLLVVKVERQMEM